MSTPEQNMQKTFDGWMDETIRQMQLDECTQEEIEKARFAMGKTKLAVCGVKPGKIFINKLSGATARRTIQPETNIPVWMVMYLNGNPEILQTINLPNSEDWIEVPLPEGVEDFPAQPDPVPVPSPGTPEPDPSGNEEN